MIFDLVTYDHQLFFLLNRLRQPWLEEPVAIFSYLGKGMIWSVLVALAILIFARKQRLPKAFLFLVGGMLLDTLVHFLKEMMGRTRPFEEFATELAEGSFFVIDRFGLPTNPSFPSGHTALAFATAIMINMLFEHRHKWLYLLALVTAYTRIYMGVHYPLDVLAGAFLGLFYGALFIQVTKNFLPHFPHK